VTRAPVSVGLAAASVAVFAWAAGHGSTTEPADLIRFGALDQARVWQGEWWRLLSAAFLHAGLLHLGWNLLFGLPLCVTVERALGWWRFLALYLASAVGASAASLLGSHAVSVGSSGAVFGVAGALLVLLRRTFGSTGALLRDRTVRNGLLLSAAFAVATAWLPVDHLAHLGGLVTGGAMAWLGTRPRPRPAWPWAVLALALAGGVATALRPSPAWRERRAAIAEIHAAVKAGDPDRALALVTAARARGLQAAGLDYYEGLALAEQGDLEGALARLRPLAAAPDGPARAEARRAVAAVARRLAARLLTGDVEPGDAARGLALLDEACGAGDAEACSLADAQAARLGR